MDQTAGPVCGTARPCGDVCCSNNHNHNYDNDNAVTPNNDSAIIIVTTLSATTREVKTFLD